MRTTSSLIRGAVLTAAVAMVPAVASATPGDIWARTFRLCGSGAVSGFKTCHSVQLTTTDLGSATGVTVAIRNLQGGNGPLGDQLFYDNSPWSALRILRFYGTGTANPSDVTPTLAGSPTAVPFFNGTATTGGASAWNYAMTQASGEPMVLRMNGGPTAAPNATNRMIGGCTPGSGPNTPMMYTCHGQIIMSFQTSTLFNASNLTGGYFSAYMGDGASGSETVVCQTSSATITGGTSTLCDVSGTNATLVNPAQFLGNGGPPATVPEPMTIALLGSGLAGVAAARRRKKTTEE